MIRHIRARRVWPLEDKGTASHLETLAEPIIAFVDEQILAEAKTLPTDVEAMAEQALGTRREPRTRQRTTQADAPHSTRPAFTSYPEPAPGQLAKWNYETGVLAAASRPHMTTLFPETTTSTPGGSAENQSSAA